MLDPQNFYISEGMRTELDALYLRHTNEPALLPNVIERLPEIVLRYILALERRVNARAECERDFFDNVYRQLKQAMINIPRAREVVSFVAERLLDEPTVTRWTSDGLSYLAYL
ncbi:hypothetical protein BZA05DRAFT_421319 [Tricharina praecox]|uniref:uncharacterized protein n=1 Tax=Tricharina praecox TaxID=43433 RepID=UPI00221F0E4B|nr:uncharacterized protein BZA05DRAFT_421319 [Tricharina praecox]KAI5845491.1 hypothetical protein BZA05DRAFT_421319 [Tricharina praecox]